MNLELEKVIELLPAKTSLQYVDYNDNMNEQASTIQDCIHTNDMSALYEKVDEWFQEQEFESVKQIKKDLRKEIQQKFEISKSEAKDFLEENEDAISDAIYSRNDTDVVADLFRNTSKFIMFFDTCYEVESESWSWSDAQIRLERINIKKVLKIKSSDYDSRIDMMIRQASYGGRLVIYFRISADDLIGNKDEAKTILFKDPEIAIIDNGGGSGDNCNLKGYSVKFDFNRKNIFIDKNVSYSYTYDVCGMSEDWCDSTEIQLLEEEVEKMEESKINDFLDKEKQLDEVFKKGGCTFGDMKYERHRNKTYRNDYPCGNKCTDCGNFWID